MAGSVRQRGAQSWELRAYAGRDERSGRRLYVTRTVRGSRRDAERALAKLVTEVEEGSVAAGGGTVGELCERWLAAAGPDLSPTVRAEYRRLLDRHVLPAFGPLPLRRLRTDDLDAWYGRLRSSGGVSGRPLSASSVQRVHAVLRRALNQAVRWGWIPVNPAAKATPPRVLRKPMRVPQPAEVAGLVAAADSVNPALAVFIRLAAVSGARRGELCALRWRHIDFERGELHIEGALVQVGRRVLEKDTKSHAERRVSLDGATLRALDVHRSNVERALARAGARRATHAFVFSHELDGSRPWRPNYVTLAFSRLAGAQGLHGVRLHDLRHFAATTMLTSGVDVRTAAGRLGHANTSTTLDVYAHFIKRADQNAAALLGAALDASAPPSAAS